jgi:hypothetical protein
MLETICTIFVVGYGIFQVIRALVRLRRMRKEDELD